MTAAVDSCVVNVSPGETRVALLADGQTVEVLHHRAGNESLVGNVYLGRVVRVVAGVQAAFVDIGAGRDGFLNGADARTDPDSPTQPIGALVHEGEAVLVQVQRDAVGDKGARLTMRPTLPGRRLVLAPGQGRVSISRRIEDEALRTRLGEIVGGLAEPGEGFVVRTAAADVDAAEFTREAALLRARWTAIQSRRKGAEAPVLLHRDLDPVLRSLRDHGDAGLAHVHVDSVAVLTDVRRFCAELLPELSGTLQAYREDEPIFERFGVEAALEEALGRTVALPSGGRLVIDEAEALSAIDVDTRGASSGADALFRVNLEAAEAIPRQLRLRAIGGLIVIDFAHLKRDDQRRQVLDALRAALAGDRASVAPGGFTRLGLVEMTRRRERPTLIETIGAPCPTCGGRHALKSAETVALDILRRVARDALREASGRIGLTVAPEIEAELTRPGNRGLAALSDAAGRDVELRADTALAREGHDVVYG